MEPISVLEVGQKYSKKDLASLIDEPRLLNVREGVSSCDNSDSYLLFVDLEKEDKEKRFHFDDFFEKYGVYKSPAYNTRKRAREDAKTINYKVIVSIILNCLSNTPFSEDDIL